MKIEDRIRQMILRYKGYQEWSGAQGQGSLSYSEVIKDLKMLLQEGSE